ncbi:MAG: SpoIID/LytB domain-containing protein [Acidobacteria bacterium]|nr:SpoIID/LytB domain-containing protein [Acidobacteriota bacterium]
MRRLLLASLASGLVAALIAPVARAAGTPDARAAGTPAPASPASGVTPASSADRLILEPRSADTLFQIEAHFPGEDAPCKAKRTPPLRARYRGRIEIALDPDGRLSILDRLDFSDYLAGLAEVPPSWPREALRAQAIAARSYALHSISHPPPSARARGYDICATDRCQVFRGAAVELGAFGERWREAVESTQGLALTYAGRAISAFYFSTSAGHTRTNADAWGTTPLPYLRRVRAYDEDAPLARWTARVPLADLARILRAAGRWSTGAVTSVTVVRGGIRIRGTGDARTLSKGDLRGALNDQAPCEIPGRYPGEGRAGRRLPLTVPSVSYTASQEGTALVLRGRGWGHGVGMSQWGARALAARGWSTARILTHFYRARLERTPEPRTIRVLAAEGARRVAISIEGRARLATGTGGTLATGERFEILGGETLEILRGAGPSLAPVLALTSSLGPQTLPPGATLTVPFTLNRAARVAVEVRAESAAPSEAAPGARAEGSFEAGDGSVEAPLAGLAPGRYQLALEAFDGIDRVRTREVALTIVAPAPPPRARHGDGSGRWVLAAAMLSAALLAALIFTRRARRSRTRA